MARLYQYANNPQTALSGSITAGATSINVASSAAFPTTGTFHIIIDSELMRVTGVSGTTWTVVRGAESTSAASHNNNATVTGVLTAGAVTGEIDALYAAIPEVPIQAEAAGGRNFRIVSCVIRNDGAGAWETISDSAHGNINVTSVVADTSKIRLTYDFTASKVIGFLVTPDEAFASVGWVAGSSVGLSFADITLAKAARTIGGYFAYDGASWTSTGATGAMAVSSYTGGTLTLTHNSISDVNASVVARDGGVIAGLGAIGATSTEVKFFNSSGTLLTSPTTAMKFYVTRSQAYQEQDPTTSHLTVAAGNLWVFGIFEV